MSSSSGPEQSARARATLCRSPPESPVTPRPRSAPRSSTRIASAGSTSRPRRPELPALPPRRAPPAMTFSRTVQCGKSSPSWGTYPIRLSSGATRNPRSLSSQIVPSKRMCPSARISPASARSSVDFPAPEAPKIPIVPSSDLKRAPRAKPGRPALISTSRTGPLTVFLHCRPGPAGASASPR
jgi:hypothetical protein